LVDSEEHPCFRPAAAALEDHELVAGLGNQYEPEPEARVLGWGLMAAAVI
jgi:hypothetical protein